MENLKKQEVNTEKVNLNQSPQDNNKELKNSSENMEAIKDKRRNTTSWMNETDKILERFTKKYDSTIMYQNVLKKGLKEFDLKRE